MLILERYIGRSFFSSALLAWLMLTFVFAVGLLIRATDLISRGFKVSVILDYLASGIPETFGITIPLAVLVSALLVFGRLSADSEIAAMRACGMNLFMLMRVPLLVGLLLTGFCFYVQNSIIPPNHLARRNLQAHVDAASVLALLEPGRFTREFRDMEMYFERREGNWLHNIMILDTSVGDTPRDVRAEKALIEQTGKDLRIDFYRVRVDPFYPDRPGAAFADRFSHTITNAFEARPYYPQDEDKRLPELIVELHHVDATLAQKRVEYRAAMKNENATKQERDSAALGFRFFKARVRSVLFEINRRAAFAMAPFCFILIGIPLGIRSHRRESTAGIGIALGVAFCFYLFQILAQAAVKHPFLPAHILVWIPVAICFGIACWLIPRNQ